jgi:hypothetical protein
MLLTAGWDTPSTSAARDVAPISITAHNTSNWRALIIGYNPELFEGVGILFQANPRPAYL